MKRPLFCLGLTAAFVALGQLSPALGQTKGVRIDPENPRYTHRTQHSRDGIGKFYMGREIAHVMGHLGAGWLERPSRELEEKPQTLIRSLKLKAGDNVADIGVGTGYFARRIARVIGPKGTVYGVDIQPEMLELLAKNLGKLGIKNGDVVHSVNGHDLTSMSSALSAFDSLQSERERARTSPDDQ